MQNIMKNIIILLCSCCMYAAHAVNIDFLVMIQDLSKGSVTLPQTITLQLIAHKDLVHL